MSTSQLLRIATAGSVDDGKSTLIGRLLYDSKAIFTDQLESIERTSAERGDEYANLALLTDGLTLDEIGAHLGTATGTVRNQLKQVFAKTGARRQGDLIRLIMNLS